MNSNTIGALIASIRKENGWTQKELSEKLNVSDKAVSKWETGRGTPDIGSLEKLASVLNISVSELLAGKRFDCESTLTSSDEVLVKAMRRSRKKLLKAIFGIIGGILAVTIAAVGAFLCLHYFGSINENDSNALKAQTIKSVKEGPWHGSENTEVLSVKQKGMYIATLVRDGDSSYTFYFEQDEIFKNRYSPVGGAGITTGQIGCSISRMQSLPVLKIIFGCDLPENAAYYSVVTEESRVVTVPIENGSVLDIHLQIQGNATDFGNTPILLDENFEPI